MKKLLLAFTLLLFFAGQAWSGSFDSWGQRLPITIQSSKVVSTESNVPVLLTEDNFPSSTFDDALNGGGDLRFTSDIDGNTRLACEVVDFDTGSDEAEVWVKIPSLSSSSDTTIYCWYGKAGETQPAIDAAYGAEAVWSSDFKGVWHLDEAGDSTRVDSTQYDEDLTESAGDTIAEVAGKIGNCADFELNDTEYLYRADGSDVDISGADQELTICGWTNMESFTADGYWVSKYDNDSNERQYAINNTTDGDTSSYLISNNGTDYDFARASTDTSTGTWYFQCLTYDDSYIRGYVDGSVDSDVTWNPRPFSAGINDGSALFRLGSRGDNDRYFDGRIDEVWVLDTALSAGFIETVYNNQSSPSTFAIEGTPEAPTTYKNLYYYHQQQ